MAKLINCGKFWTVLSVECWLNPTCKKCIYSKYCNNLLKDGKPTLKIVVELLLERFGKPPEKMISMARENTKNPIVLFNLKKNNK